MNSLGDKMKDTTTAAKAAGHPLPRFAFQRITLSENGMMASTREYEVIRTANGARVSLYDGPWNYHEGTKREACLQARKEGDASFYNELARKFEELGLASWDGFSKSAYGVLDGTTFSFEAEMGDGKKIFACGSNAFPKNYGAFTDYLWNLVKS